MVVKMIVRTNTVSSLICSVLVYWLLQVMSESVQMLCCLLLNQSLQVPVRYLLCCTEYRTSSMKHNAQLNLL